MDGELELIRRIAARVGVRGGVSTGIGDDAAVLDDGTVLSLDMVVDGVHVSRATHSPADIGHTALAVNLSDVAAMGAVPVAALVGLGVPEGLTGDDVDAMYGTMEALAERHGMSIAGGDVSASPVLTLSVAIVGRTPAGVRPVLRSGGRAGDLLVVTGPLGASAAGLMLLGDPALAPDLPHRDALVTNHLRPSPMVDDGLHLGESGATAMIDISDGLLLDADRVARASSLMAEVDLAAVPVAPGVAEVVAAGSSEPARAMGHEAGTAPASGPEATALFAATGGEDYQLLAAVPPSAGLEPHVTVVGRLVEGSPGVRALYDGQDVTPDRLGWEHRPG
ncbi:MAG: thiamine-phosphate kinase [Actinomycetota bacterium]